MTVTTYVATVIDTGSGQSGQIVPTIANGVLTSTTTDALPGFIPFQDFQADWSVSDTSSLKFVQNKPTIPAAQVNSDWNSVAGISRILNKPTLATVATSGSYNDLSNKPTIPAAQIQSDWTQSSSGALDFIKNKPAARSQSATSRSLNTGFQISTTRDALVNYAVNVTTTASLAGGQTGTVFLDIASDSGFTANVQSFPAVNGNSVTLAIALTAVQTVTATLSYYVPAGYYVRLRTVNTLGTPSFTYGAGQEVLL